MRGCAFRLAISLAALCGSGLSPAQAQSGGTASSGPRAAGQPAFAQTGAPAGGTIERLPPAQIQLRQSKLTIDERPLFPRLVEYRGEPLGAIQQLGFNGIFLERVPEAALLAEARRLGMWVVCPPPRLEGASGARPRGLIGPALDPVLAWWLGGRLTAADIARVREMAAAVRAADVRGHRPLVCEAQEQLRTFSRHVDILVFQRPALGSTLEIVDLMRWLRERPRLARPGTPRWVVVETEAAVEVDVQMALLAGDAAVRPAAAPDQIRLLTYAALSSGANGLLFRSRQRLDDPSPASRLRGVALAKLNQELALIEPWIAGGVYDGSIRTEDAQIDGGHWRSPRMRLLTPLFTAPGSQIVADQAAGNNLTLLIPGVPEASDAYELSATGVRKLRSSRTAGGIRVIIDEMDLTDIILLTNNPVVLSHLAREVGRLAPQAAKLTRELAAAKLAAVSELTRQLTAMSQNTRDTTSLLATAHANLRHCDTYLAAGRYDAAETFARRALRPLRLVERKHWEAAMADLSSPATSPLATSAVTLPAHWRLMGQVRGARFGRSLVREGSMENLARMQQEGWRHYRHDGPGVESSAELTTETVHGGTFSLRLRAAAPAGQPPPDVLESAPVWITSPLVSARPGTLARITGWIRSPGGVQGSVDGVLVFDSAGGPALADRIHSTRDWERFEYYRAVPNTGAIQVTIALSGIGEALIDDVTIEPLLPGAATPGQTGTARVPFASAAPRQASVPFAGSQRGRQARAPVPSRTQ